MAVIRLAPLVVTALFVSGCSTLGATGSWEAAGNWERVPDDKADLGELADQR